LTNPPKFNGAIDITKFIEAIIHKVYLEQCVEKMDRILKVTSTRWQGIQKVSLDTSSRLKSVFEETLYGEGIFSYGRDRSRATSRYMSRGSSFSKNIS
jgi:hypothetical protein